MNLANIVYSRARWFGSLQTHAPYLFWMIKLCLRCELFSTHLLLVGFIFPLVAVVSFKRKEKTLLRLIVKFAALSLECGLADFFFSSLFAPVLSTHAVRFCQQETTNKRTSRNNKAWDLWRNWLFSNSNRKSLFDRAESEHWRKKKGAHTP